MLRAAGIQGMYETPIRAIKAPILSYIKYTVMTIIYPPQIPILTVKAPISITRPKPPDRSRDQNPRLPSR